MGLKHWYRWNIHTPVRHFFGLKAKTDWIDAYSHMAKKMLPYLYDFRDNEKMGTPVFDEPKCCIDETKEQAQTREDKWKHIIDEIIFALEYCTGDNDDDCQVPNLLYNPNQKEFFKSTPVGEDGTSALEFNEDYGATKIDIELLKKKNERVQNGLKLMGEYFMNLWD